LVDERRALLLLLLLWIFFFFFSFALSEELDYDFVVANAASVYLHRLAIALFGFRYVCIPGRSRIL
jgi:hypothetical protein